MNNSVASVAAVEVVVTVLLAELHAASFHAFIGIRALGGAIGILAECRWFADSRALKRVFFSSDVLHIFRANLEMKDLTQKHG